jgi:NitT/TauT family transport system ATP-binding protein
MSPRPGRVSQTVEVALPRPRTLDMMRSPELFASANEVRDGLFGRTGETAAVNVESW